MKKAIEAPRLYECPLEATLHAISGKWAVFILWHLLHRDRRYGELKRMIPNVTEKMLIQSLREMTDEGIIQREVYSQVPPKVVYSLTAKGLTLKPVLESMCQWGKTHSGRWRRPPRAAEPPVKTENKEVS